MIGAKIKHQASVSVTFIPLFSGCRARGRTPTSVTELKIRRVALRPLESMTEDVKFLKSLASQVQVFKQRFREPEIKFRKDATKFPARQRFSEA